MTRNFEIGSKHCRQFRGESEVCDATPIGKQERVDTDIQCIVFTLDLIERRSNIVRSPDSELVNLKVKRVTCCLSLACPVLKPDCRDWP